MIFKSIFIKKNLLLTNKVLRLPGAVHLQDGAEVSLRLLFRRQGKGDPADHRGPDGSSPQHPQRPIRVNAPDAALPERQTLNPKSLSACRDLLPGQKAIAMITEMIHTASLVHDDVIDGSDARRGKRSLNEVWGEKKVWRPRFPDRKRRFPRLQRCSWFLLQAILAGDFILSAASMALARIGDITVVKVLSQVIEDLVRGAVRGRQLHLF